MGRPTMTRSVKRSRLRDAGMAAAEVGVAGLTTLAVGTEYVKPSRVNPRKKASRKKAAKKSH